MKFHSIGSWANSEKSIRPDGSLRPGTRLVKVKSWDTLVKQFGSIHGGKCIDCKPHFGIGIYNLLPLDRIVIVSYVKNISYLDGNGVFLVSPDIIEKELEVEVG